MQASLKPENTNKEIKYLEGEGIFKFVEINWTFCKDSQS